MFTIILLLSSHLYRMGSLLLSVALMGNVLTSSSLCEGVRLDRTMTYHEFLQEFALDLKAQETYRRAGQFELLAQMKYEKYLQQAPKVRRAQRVLCGAESPNWR
jgi:hypothetical protein